MFSKIIFLVVVLFSANSVFAKPGKSLEKNARSQVRSKATKGQSKPKYVKNKKIKANSLRAEKSRGFHKAKRVHSKKRFAKNHDRHGYKFKRNKNCQHKVKRPRSFGIFLPL